MTAEIPTTEPQSFTAGDLVQWYRTDLTDCYPATEYTLTYYLVKTSYQEEIIASASGSEFLVSIPTTTTADYDPGVYSWNAYVSKTGERFKVDAGTMEVLTDFSQQTTGYDDRSSAQKIYDSITAVLEGRATKTQESYSIEGRALSRTPIPDLLLLRDKFKGIVDKEKQAEDIANGLSTRNRVNVRFNRP